MNTKFCRVVGTIVAALAFSSISQVANAACTFSNDALQNNLNSLFGTGVGYVSATDDCIDEGVDGQWVNSPGIVPQTQLTLLFELTGLANGNRMGIYDVLDPNNRLILFFPDDAPGKFMELTVTDLGNGSWSFTRDNTQGATSTAVFSSAVFGFFLSTNNIRYYSETDRNRSAGDRMYAYEGSFQPFLGGPSSLRGAPFAPDDFILAWEDVTNDWDYNDMVALVRNVTPNATVVPLPASVWLLLSGLVGLVGIGRRRSLSAPADAQPATA